MNVRQPTWEAKIPALICGFFKVLNTGPVLFPLKSIVIYHWLQYNVLLKSLPELFASVISQSFQNKMTVDKKDKTILAMSKKATSFSASLGALKNCIFSFSDTPKLTGKKKSKKDLFKKKMLEQT